MHPQSTLTRLPSGAWVIGGHVPKHLNRRVGVRGSTSSTGPSFWTAPGLLLLFRRSCEMSVDKTEDSGLGLVRGLMARLQKAPMPDTAVGALFMRLLFPDRK
jgi:hypothetical protein